MSHGTSPPILPDGEGGLARWRVGLVAFRDAANAGYDYLESVDAGANAMAAAFPEMTRSEARKSTVQAVGWVTRSEYVDWFCAGRPKREWVWPPHDGDVGYKRRPGSKRA